MKKICSTCKIEKNCTDFHKKGNGYNHSCKECRSEYSKKHYNKNKEKYKKRSKIWKDSNKDKVISNRYKQEIEIVKSIMDIGYCEICNTNSNLVFDHIHETNQARGCLCRDCNTMLGRLGDSNEEILLKINKIMKYISK